MTAEPSQVTIASQTLAATRDYQITLHQHVPPRDKIIITFGGIGSGLSDKGFASDFSLRRGWDNIYVAQREKSQYQGLDVQTFADVTAPILAGRTAFTYGTSLGAYCALYFGGAVDARIIAFSPRNSAHPMVAQKEFLDVDFRHRDLTAVPRATHAPVVLFDPMVQADDLFIRNWVLPAYPDANLVTLPHAGHTAIRTMKEAGALKSFLVSVIDDGTVPTVDLGITDGAVWHRERAKHFHAAGDLDAAAAEYRTSLELQIEKGTLNGLLLTLFARNRRADLAHAIKDFVRADTADLIRPELKARLKRNGIDLDEPDRV